MKFLLIPGNNSLSHVAKCAAVETALTRRSHCAHIAVSKQYSGFLKRLGLAHFILPDIQESDGGALPSLAWFRLPDLLKTCIRAEIELLKAFRPDRVLGVFRFTLKVSTAILGIPYDTLACGCMMPDMGEVLGFGPGEAKAADQALYLENFFKFAARKMNIAMDRLGGEPVEDIRDMLVGERTYLWDYPQFMPLPDLQDRYHVGPLNWSQWPGICAPPDPFSKNDRPLAVVSLGTRPSSRSVVVKAVRCLLACGYNVLVACGGQSKLMGILPENPRVRCWRFAPLDSVLCQADLMVCHGGQMTIFEALLHRVPVLVIPSQPEQAHNGVCVERIACGRRLAPSIAFKGDPQAYANAFQTQTDDEIIEKIKQSTAGVDMDKGLTRAQKYLRCFDAPNMVADLMEQP